MFADTELVAEAVQIVVGRESYLGIVDIDDLEIAGEDLRCSNEQATPLRSALVVLLEVDRDLEQDQETLAPQLLQDRDQVHFRPPLLLAVKEGGISYLGRTANQGVAADLRNSFVETFEEGGGLLVSLRVFEQGPLYYCRSFVGRQ
jgi:hypothetical protein